MKRLLKLCFAAFAVCTVIVCLTVAASAADFNVTDEATLYSALTTANANGTADNIILMNDITVTGTASGSLAPFEITSDITIRSNGDCENNYSIKKATPYAGACVFSISGSGTDAEFRHIIIDGNDAARTSPSLPLVCIYNDATLTLASGTKLCNVSNAGTTLEGAAVLCNAGGHFIMNTGSEISNCSVGGTLFGGAVCVSEADFTMNGGTITGCTAPNGGGVYIAPNGVFDMYGGKITNCTAQIQGGAVLCGGVFNIYDGLLASNVAGESGSGNGGAVFINENCQMTMSGGIISDNKVNNGQCGGAVWVWTHATFTMTGGELTYNYAKGNGGAVNSQQGYIYMTGGRVIGNSCLGKGGGICYVNPVRAQVTPGSPVYFDTRGLIMYNNTATRWGDDIWTDYISHYASSSVTGTGTTYDLDYSFGELVAAHMTDPYTTSYCLYYDGSTARFSLDGLRTKEVFNTRNTHAYLMQRGSAANAHQNSNLGYGFKYYPVGLSGASVVVDFALPVSFNLTSTYTNPHVDLIGIGSYIPTRIEYDHSVVTTHNLSTIGTDPISDQYAQPNYAYVYGYHSESSSTVHGTGTAVNYALSRDIYNLRGPQYYDSWFQEHGWGDGNYYNPYRFTGQTQITTEYGTATLNASARTLTYIPKGMSVGVETIYFEAGVSVSKNETEYLVYAAFQVIPASTIYYEDNEGFVTYTSAAGGTWRIVGTNAANGASTDNLPVLDAAAIANTVYGYAPAYSTTTSYSMGYAHCVSVHPSAGNNWPTASFTFTGTGFDVVSLASSYTGGIFVDIYEGGSSWAEIASLSQQQRDAITVRKWAVDTYYGYSYNTSTGTWVKAEQDNTLYQVPIISADMTSLEKKTSPGSFYGYGTYTVVITPFYTDSFNHKQNTGNYSFYLDGVRIYNPIEDTNQIAKSYYKASNEANPVFVELRDLLLDAGTISQGSTTGALFVNGTLSVNDANLNLYSTSGPKNEVYLAQGQAVAFYACSKEVPSTFQIGARSVYGNSLNMNIGSTQSSNITLATTTDMFYNIAGNLTWRWSDMYDCYITADPIVITNTSNALLAVTDLKWTFDKDYPSINAYGCGVVASLASAGGSGELPSLASAAYNQVWTALEETKIPGDVNNDGDLDLLDAFKLRLALSKNTQLNTLEAFYADFNSDGKVNAKDIYALRCKLVGIN